MSDGITVPDGYRHYSGPSAAEDNIGPFFYRKNGDRLDLLMLAGDKHANGMGAVHGGVLLAYADYVATMLALQGVDEHCLTVSLNSDFLAGARVGDRIEGGGEIVRRTRTMTFIRGQLAVAGEPVLAFQAVLRRVPKKAG